MGIREKVIYFGADSNYEELNKHHQGTIQEYLLCATPIMADVVISLPKMKTHKKQVLL